MMHSTLREREDALKEAFRNWPALPSGLALHILGRNGGDYTKDWAKGKQMQADAHVPYEAEAEIGAGFWDRITNGAWREAK